MMENIAGRLDWPVYPRLRRTMRCSSRRRHRRDLPLGSVGYEAERTEKERLIWLEDAG